MVLPLSDNSSSSCQPASASAASTQPSAAAANPTQAGQPTGAGVNTGAGTTRPKTQAEIEADRLYEENMEDEYAKREGATSDQRPATSDQRPATSDQLLSSLLNIMLLRTGCVETPATVCYIDTP
ncbi:hypothetical protein SODALDRAFT_381878 [Sodiomyces alkalinus F11]|uniref:Uncharacterized protein n=1 Tax=Sodiomyces alkalinus (strain CBS 110278 / VKM F-3762 / F11) TaxID=1314773 RepID=A0A3N2PK47_SODAK|nr:hypothetical protein SODALDRAFT_381878 [Sodiomyces alkalinus F11]ROT34901.1 hypothetical protein SODALDRAFT_381878 [Sodiomyces alkalinus F11]